MAFSLKEQLARQWRLPEPGEVPCWRFIRAVKPFVNAVGGFFGVLTVLGLTLLWLNGCTGETDSLPGITAWLDENGKVERIDEDIGRPGEPFEVRIFDHAGNMTSTTVTDFDDVLGLIPPEQRERIPELARELKETGKLPVEALLPPAEENEKSR